MRTYSGIKDDKGGPCVVWICDGDGFDRPLDPGPSQAVWNHSPDGFQWGYGGSGPAQLALAILLDLTQDKDLSVQRHQAFKHDFVCRWGNEWTVGADQIRDWLKVKMMSEERGLK